MTKAHGKGKLIVKTQKKGNVIQITFSDDGPGISEEDLKSIFNPFFTTKEVGEGTGLGLSICYGIVQEHSGALYVKSKLRDGATFTVEMPIVQEQISDEQVDLTVPWSI
jgi:signal transduction histidine kinase